MIRIHTLPADDLDFRAHLRAAIIRIDPAADRLPGQLVTRSEGNLRLVLPEMRDRYPDLWIRRQVQMAMIDGLETLDVFRDTRAAEYDGARSMAGQRGGQVAYAGEPW